MSVCYPTPFVTCDCECKDETGCKESDEPCDFSPTDTYDDGESCSAADPGWYNVDDSPGDGEGEHYCGPCGRRLGISEEFLQS